VEDGLILHWDVYNPSCATTITQILDLSGNSYNGVLSGTKVTPNVSYKNRSVQFSLPIDSSGIYIKTLNYTTGSSDSISNLTVEFWCRSTSGSTGSTNDERILVSFDRSAVYRFAIGDDTLAAAAGKPVFSFTGGGGSGTTSYARALNWSGDLRDNSYHQVVVTYTSSAVKFYIDGSLVDTVTGSFGNIGDHTESETPRYGWVGNGSEATTEGGTPAPTNMFYGNISVVRIYNRTLTDNEILLNFNANSFIITL
jgi:hypothetical protein